MELKYLCRLNFFVFVFLHFHVMHAQDVDHWEIAVLSDDLWYYSLGNNSIPPGWKAEGFNVQQWQQGAGGFGYGDGDDQTILPNTLSVYLRTEFDIVEESDISALSLLADYDDGFVAYLNGVEIARNNLGDPGNEVAWNETAFTWHEAGLYRGINPEPYSIADVNLIKNGKNILAIQVHNHDITSSDLSSNFFIALGIGNDSEYYRPPPDWLESIFFQSNLPIIQITTPGNAQIVDEPRIEAHMGVIDNGEGQYNSIFDPFTDYDGKIAIEIRGTSSQMFEKKNYGFETREEDGSNNNVPLLGMPQENDWTLHGPYSDKSLLRNAFTYHLGRLTGQYAPRTRLCELLINEEYKGIYVLTEKIKQDKNRVDISKLNEDENSGDDLTGGYIIKVDRNPQNIPDKGWYSTFPDYKFYEYVDPDEDDITEAQKDYIQNYMFSFESAMDRNDYEDTYDDYIDLTSWVDYLLVSEISKHIDVYKLSFYMYKDKDSKGGKLHMGPLWDINLGYGNFDFDCSADPEGWAYEFPLCGSWHPFWARKIADIPNVQHLTHCRWEELRAGPFRTDSLMNYIDQQVDYMGSAIDRNFERWQVLGQYVWPNAYVGASYQEEIDFFKNWIVARLEWMDENMVGDCDLFTSDSNPSAVATIKVYPNPAMDMIRLDNLPLISEFSGVEIFDVQGKKVLHGNLNPSSNAISIAELSNGFYILTVMEDGRILGRTTFVKHGGG